VGTVGAREIAPAWLHVPIAGDIVAPYTRRMQPLPEKAHRRDG
jgi:hypothetical protein